MNSIADGHLRRWRLTPDGALAETHSSWIMPVRRGACLSMLKVFKNHSDERNAAMLLRHWDGDGAVRLYAADETAVLLERADAARSLVAMALAGADAQAAEILAATVARLHAPRPHKFAGELTPLAHWFSPLDAHAATTPLLGRCARVARALLASEADVGPLHGDLHHGNVLDGGERGWLAIDPKGLSGERSYEIANLLGNPWPHGELVHQPERMRRLAALYAGRLGLDVQRVLAFALAHAGLAASWDLEDGADPAYRLRCAEVLAPLVDGA